MKKNNLDLSNLVLYKILAVNTINKTNNFDLENMTDEV